jgi:hypothetical protein
MSHHLNNLSNPPHVIGDRVKIIEDGIGGEVHIIVGAQYDPRPVASSGWSFWVISEDGIDTGEGGTDGFTYDQLATLLPSA